jgi:hypothetical protein
MGRRRRARTRCDRRVGNDSRIDARIPQPSAREVRGVARELGGGAAEISAVKVPGPGGIGESILTYTAMPSIEGFGQPVRGDLEVETRDGSVRSRATARYDSPDGSILVASHEDGPIVYTLLAAAGNIAAVTAGVAALVRHIRGRRKTKRRPEEEWIYERDVRWGFESDGNVVREERVKIKADT